MVADREGLVVLQEEIGRDSKVKLAEFSSELQFSKLKPQRHLATLFVQG